MYLFSILIIPAAILVFFEKITPKNIYQIISGLIVSLIFSVIFWSLSTFYSPFSYTFFSKFLFILFKEYLTLVAFTVYICICYYRDLKLQPVYFVAGFFISVTIFSVALNYNSNNLFVLFIQPILLTLYIYLYSFIKYWKFNKKDKFLKLLLLSLFPLTLILLKLFFNIHIINTAVIMIIVLALMSVIYINRKRMFVKNV